VNSFGTKAMEENGPDVKEYAVASDAANGDYDIAGSFAPPRAQHRMLVAAPTGRRSGRTVERNRCWCLGWPPKFVPVL